MKPNIVSLIICLFGVSINLFGGDPDFFLKKHLEYSITQNKKTSVYELRSKTFTEYSLLSDQAVNNLNVLTFSEPFFGPVREIKASLNNSSIRSKNMYFKASQSEDVFFSDYKVHFINYGDEVKKMDVLSYSYEQEFSSINYLPLIFVPNVNKIAEFKVSIDHPSHLTAEFEFFFSTDSVAYEIKTELKKNEINTTTLAFKNIDFKKTRVNFDYNEFHCAVLVKMKSGTATINAVEPADFMKWYQTKLNFSPKIEDPLPSEIKSIFDSTLSSLGKVKALHNFVRKNVRYIADMKNSHSFVPHSPDYVLKNMFGDCKDKAYLIMALANQIGIKVNLVLLSTDRNIPFTGAHVTNYDHVICSYEENGKTYYFDPTSEYTEFGNLPSHDISSYAFVMDTLNPKLIYVPKPEQKPNIEIEISAHADSLKKAHAVIRLNNDYFSQSERVRKELREVDIENFLNSVINSNFYKISLDYFKLTSFTENSAVYEAETDLSSFLIESKNKTYLPKFPFSIYEKGILDRETDAFGLNFNNPQSIDFTLNLKHNNMIVNEGSTEESVSDIGTIKSKLEIIDRGTVRMTAHFKQEQKNIRADQKRNFIGFVKNILKGKTQMYIFSRSAQ